MSAPLLILTGPPGVGKTTVASMFADRHDPSAVVAGDHFFDYCRRGKIPPWEPASNEQNTKVVDITVRTAVAYAEAGWTTVLEGIIGPWFAGSIGRATAGFDVSYAVLGAPAAMCVERVRVRGVGPDTGVVEKMHGEFERADIGLGHRIDATADPAALLDTLVDAMSTGALRL